MHCIFYLLALLAVHLTTHLTQYSFSSTISHRRAILQIKSSHVCILSQPLDMHDIPSRIPAKPTLDELPHPLLADYVSVHSRLSLLVRQANSQVSGFKRSLPKNVIANRLFCKRFVLKLSNRLYQARVLLQKCMRKLVHYIGRRESLL